MTDPATQSTTYADMMAAERVIRELADRFDVRNPDGTRITVEWYTTPTKREGWAAYRRGFYTIKLQPRPSRGWTVASLVHHEFAHILTYDRRRKAGRSGSDHHSRVFYRALLETIRAAGCQVAAHPWRAEYETLAGFARSEGYFTGLTDYGVKKAAIEATVAHHGAAYVGAKVQWTSPKHFGPQRGTVVSCQRGCRAKIRLPGGGLWMVPQGWLTLDTTEAP